jgi:hypothetical protein
VAISQNRPCLLEIFESKVSAVDLLLFNSFYRSLCVKFSQMLNMKTAVASTISTKAFSITTLSITIKNAAHNKEDKTFLQSCHAEYWYAECYSAALRIKNSFLKSVVTNGALSNTVFSQSKTLAKKSSPYHAE